MIPVRARVGHTGRDGAFWEILILRPKSYGNEHKVGKCMPLKLLSPAAKAKVTDSCVPVQPAGGATLLRTAGSGTFPSVERAVGSASAAECTR